MKTFVRSSVAALLPLMLASGCALVQVAFPAGADKAAFTQYNVIGKSELAMYAGALTIGDYSVKVSRGWTATKSSTGSSLFRSDTETDKSQKYSYTVSGPESFSAAGECQTWIKVEKERGVLSTESSPSSTKILEDTLVCAFPGADRKPYEMKLEKVGKPEGYDKKGTLKGPGVEFTVETTTSIKGKPSGSWLVTGYYFYDKGTLVAVIDSTKLGAVYISKDLRKELFPVIMNASAALLAYQDLALVE